MRIKIIKTFLVLGMLFGIALPALPVSAAGAEIYLTSNHAMISDGASVVIAVYMNGGGSPINAVEADLNYPASKLEYAGISYGGSAFSINTPTNGGGNGAVSIQNGSVSPISGSGLIATVTFKALVGSGSAAIGVSGSSSLINADTNAAVAYATGAVSVNFGSTAVATTKPSTDSDTSTTTKAVAPVVVAPPKDVTPPVISAIKLENVTPYTATVTWTTNEPADSTVEYGVDTTYGLSASSTTLTTTHAVALSSSFLSPETLLHYAIKTADASGNVQTSPDQQLNLPGVPITVIVRGASGKPQPGASVTLDNKTATTNNQGSVTIPSALGNEKVITTYNGSTVVKPITVVKSSKPLVAYQLDLSRQPVNHWMITSITLVVIILLLLGFDAVMFGSRIFSRLMGFHLQPKRQAAHNASDVLEEPVPPPATHETPRVVATPPLASSVHFAETLVGNNQPVKTASIVPDPVATALESHPSTESTEAARELNDSSASDLPERAVSEITHQSTEAPVTRIAISSAADERHAPAIVLKQPKHSATNKTHKKVLKPSHKKAKIVISDSEN